MRTSFVCLAQLLPSGQGYIGTLMPYELVLLCIKTFLAGYARGEPGSMNCDLYLA